METQRLNRNKGGAHERDHDWDEVHSQMLQVQKKSQGNLIQRQEDGDPWVKDHDATKDYYYNTEVEALRRRANLEKSGAWEEYRVVSFVSGSKTYWRVEMRGPKSSSGEGSDVATDKQTTTTDQGTGTDDKSQSDETPTKHTFALTFDDGPHVADLGGGENLTENVLDTLQEKNVKAGFFIQTGVSYRGAHPIGKQLVKRMHKDGHVVGVHTGGTKDHERHTTTNTAGRLEKELNAGKAYIKEQTGEDPKYVRPPEGVYDKPESAVYAKVGLTNLMWDIDGDQGKNLDKATLEKRLDNGIAKMIADKWVATTTSKPKIVVLYHDIQSGTSKAIGSLIDYIRKKVKELTNNKDDVDFDAP